MFESHLTITKTPGKSKEYLLAAPLVFRDGEQTWTVPSGFKTDLSTFWIEGRHTECAVLHDWVLYATRNDYRIANSVMRRAMVSIGVRSWHLQLIMLGVEFNRFIKEVFK